MGSFAELTYGEYFFASYKNHFPLHALLLFDRSDLVMRECSDEEQSFDDYAFVTDAASARRRLETIGISFGTCKRWFEQLMADHLTYVDPIYDQSSKLDFREMIRRMPVTFDTYIRYKNGVDIVNEHYREHGGSRTIESGPRKEYSDYDFFTHEATMYFHDVIDCIDFRISLESVPDETAVVLSISEVLDSGWLDAHEIDSLFDHYIKRMDLRLEFTYKMYGYAVDTNPNLLPRLRQRLDTLTEDDFIDHILIPLFNAMGAQGVRRVAEHGPGEHGSDIGPFRMINGIGLPDYYSVQAKVVKIHGTSSKRGNAVEIVNQARVALKTAFLDQDDNVMKHIDRVIIATTKSVTPDAKHYIDSELDGDRRIYWFDSTALIELIRRHRLVPYVLYTDF